MPDEEIRDGEGFDSDQELTDDVLKKGKSSLDDDFDDDSTLDLGVDPDIEDIDKLADEEDAEDDMVSEDEEW